MTQEPSAQECRDRYQEQLEQEALSLEQSATHTQDDRKPVILDQQSVGRLSRMDAMQGQAMAQAMQSRRAARTGAIQAALVRLAGDDFGWCESCGEFIGLARLDLDPTCRICVECAA